MSKSDEADEQIARYVFTVISDMREHGHIPPHDLAEIERQHETFMQNIASTPKPLRELFYHAFAFGLVIGSHVGATDAAPLAMELAERARASKAGKASAATRQSRPWHAHAKELAMAIRAERPFLSQPDVASEIQAQWKLNDIEYPTHGTLETYISTLEKAGELPKRSPTKK